MGQTFLSVTPRTRIYAPALVRPSPADYLCDMDQLRSILKSVWGFDSEVSENTVEVFMGHLRHKVDFREPKLIHTMRGFGYMVSDAAARGA